MSELKRCPFCDGPARQELLSRGYRTVNQGYCLDRTCAGASVITDPEGWNRRAASAVPEGCVVVPREPSVGRLVSMAIRADHALGCPGYYDQPMLQTLNGVSHQQMLESTVRTMRQLYEEATGQGFYSEDKENHYAGHLAAAPEEGGGK